MTIDHEDRELFAMVHENRRRSGITTQTGIIVPLADAEAFALWKSRQKPRRATWQESAFVAAALLIAAASILGGLL